MKQARNYKSISKPQKANAEWGTEPGKFQAPKSLAIEEGSGNIYIADALNSRVQVFDRNLNYSFDFSCKDGLNYPWGVCIKDSLVFVTQKNENKVRMFHIDGTYITGKENSVQFCEHNFKEPLGIAVDSDNTAFVCDSRNRRIIVLQHILPNITTFDTGSVVPVDVKIHKDHLVVVATNDTEPGKKHYESTIKILLLTGETVREISLSDLISTAPQFLAIDYSENILVTTPEIGANSSRTGAIYIYSWKGKLICKLTKLFKNVKGIAIDRYGNIINVCEIDVGRLKIL